MRRTRGEMVRFRVLAERGLAAELFPGIFRGTAFLIGGLVGLAALLPLGACGADFSEDVSCWA